MTSKEAIRVLEDNRPSVIFEDEDAQKRMAELCQAIDMAVETLQADRPHGEWIPVTERLPEIDETLPLCDQISDEVLGTDTYGNIRHVYLTKCGYFEPTFCTVEEGMSVDIVAWMQLPEPYEKGDK